MSAATSFLTDLLPLCSDTVTVTAKTSYNTYGELQYGSGTTYKAYVQYIVGSRRSVTTDNRTIEYEAYIPSATLSASVDDVVAFPDGLTRPVMEVDVRSDEFGQQLVVLRCGAARRF